MFSVPVNCPNCNNPITALTKFATMGCNTCTTSTRICDKCNVVPATCVFCKSTACKNHIAACPGCGVLSCAQCSKLCTACNKTFCRTCSTGCFECGGQVCKGCQIQCGLCYGFYCTACAKACVSCKGKVCKQHWDTCTKCTGTMCNLHGAKFPGQKGSYCPGCVNTELKSKKVGKHEAVVGCAFDIDDIEVDDSVLDSFNIKLMKYSEGQKLQKAKDPSLKGKQLEHLIPNSSMVSGTGRKAPPVIGASSYSEGVALIMPVGDDQSQGTEHKFLTDRERSIDKKLEAEGKFATVNQKTSMMVQAWKETFLQFKKGDYTGTDFEGDCEKAAILLAQKLMAHNTKIGIDGDTRTRNGIVKKSKAPKKKVKKSEILDL